MKKIVFFVLLIVGWAGVRSQDTLVPRDSNLFYAWWYDPSYVADTGSGFGVNYFIHAVSAGAQVAELALRFETDTALDIVGVLFAPAYPVSDTVDHPRLLRETLHLYQAVDTGMQHLASKNVYRDPDSPLYPRPIHQFLYIDTLWERGYTPRRDPQNCVRVHNTWDWGFYEYYFDSPIRVEDSFYISIYHKTSATVAEREFGLIGQRDGGGWGRASTTFCNDLPTTPFPQIRYKIRKMIHNPSTNHYDYYPTWYDTTSPQLLLVFPIIGYGSPYARCVPVEGITYKEESNCRFHFTWSDTVYAHKGWEFTYVVDGASPESGNIVECSRADAEANVAPNVRYRAFVRPRCVGHRYGDWGEGVPFSHSQPSGIEVQAGQGLFTLTPNPTTGKVLVGLGDGVTAAAAGRVVASVLDAAGHEVMRMEPGEGSTSFEIDLAPLPSGTYVVSLTTAVGTDAQKVVKQ